MRILIAEDDSPLATVIAQAFKSEDHVTKVASNGDDALHLMHKETFDLLILDLNLPVVSGSEVLHKVRSENSDIPILILTATDEVAERVACLDAGADDYLTKPFSFSELSARIRAVLRRKNHPGQAFLKVADLNWITCRELCIAGTVSLNSPPRNLRCWNTLCAILDNTSQET